MFTGVKRDFFKFWSRGQISNRDDSFLSGEGNFVTSFFKNYKSQYLQICMFTSIIGIKFQLNLLT